VDIYFKENEFITSQRSELYGVTGFLAKCGGLMGLCLGVSVISIFELLYFCTIRVCFKAQKKSSSPSDQETNDVVVEKQLQSNETRARRLANTMKQLITDYSKRTTIQGVKYVADKKLTFIERIWWAIVVIVSVFYCGSLIADIFRRYDDSPIIISYENQETSITEVNEA
jgi:Amiloride-sensitive sodium channel